MSTTSHIVARLIEITGAKELLAADGSIQLPRKRTTTTATSSLSTARSELIRSTSLRAESVWPATARTACTSRASPASSDSPRRSTRPSVYSTMVVPGSTNSDALGRVPPRPSNELLALSSHASVPSGKQHEWRRMPCNGVADLAALSVDGQVGHRRVLTTARRRGEVIEAFDDFVRLVEAVGERPVGAAHLTHRHRRVDPTPDDVTDGEADAIVEIDHVVPVTTDEAGRCRRVVGRPAQLGQVAGRRSTASRAAT